MHMKRYLSFLLAVLMLVTLVPATASAESNMTASDNLKLLIKSWEGCRLTAYKAHSSEEYWTIGYGHYGSDVYEGMEITAERADELFEQDIKAFEAGANRTVEKYGLDVTQGQFDALVSLAYNFGTSWVEAHTSWRLARYIQAGFKDDYGNRISDLEIADAFAVLCSAGGEILPGLVKRRLNEAEIFLYENYSSNLTDFVSLTINANGGSLSGNRVVACFKDEPYRVLPNVTLSGYKHSWQDSSTGSTITVDTVADKSRTITAVWSSGSDPATYKLSVSGGDISGYYATGTKVKLIPSAISGKAFDHWTVTGATASKGSDGYYYITMPSAEVTAVAVYKDGCSRGNNCPSKNFTDLPATHWAHNDIDNVVSAGLFQGMSSTYFGVDDTMTRAMLITVLYRLEGCPDVTGYENKFSDVSSDKYYYNALLWGSHYTISNGNSDGTFDPNGYLTREQLVTFLHRYSNYKGYDTETYSEIGGYSDARQVAPYARESMCWAIGVGIVKGTSPTTLSPKEKATRAQVAVMFNRFAGGMA